MEPKDVQSFEKEKLELAYMKANLIEPKNVTLISTLGILQFIKRDWAKAERYFKECIKLNPYDH